MTRELMLRIRITALVSLAAVLVALHASGVMPVWLALCVVALALAGQLGWMYATTTTVFEGPLSDNEKTFQRAVVTVHLVALSGAAAILGSEGIAATVGACVVSMAITGSARAQDLRAAALGCAGLCLYALGSGMTDVSLLAAAVSWVATVVVLVLLRASMEHAGGSHRAPCARSRRALAPVAVSLLVGLLALLLVPTGGEGAGAPGTGFDRLGGQGGTSREGAYEGAMDLNARGSLPTHEVARVPADSPYHWRSGTLSVYDGRRFVASVDDGGAEAATSSTDGWLRVTPFMGNGAAQTDSRRTVLNVRASGYVLIAPGHLQDVSLLADQLQLLPGNTLVTLADNPTYTVSTVLTTWAREVAGPALPGSTSAGNPDLALPASVSARTRELAMQVTQGATTRGQAVAMVEDYLRDTYRYDLQAPVAPRGQDGVDHFLFESRAGFCEHFAAAEVVMLRSLGIPARVAVGYGGGVQDPNDPRVRVIKADRAHAWVEVDMGASGWLPTDATPSTDSTASGSAMDALAELINKATQDWSSRLLAAAVVLAVALVLAGLTWVTRRARRARPGVQLADTERTPLEAALDRLVLALERSGRPSHPSETLAELGARLQPAAGSLAVVQRAEYAAAEVPVEEQLAAVAALNELSAALTAQAEQEEKRRRAAQGRFGWLPGKRRRR